MQILTFLIRDKYYAIGIDLVETIQNKGAMTPVPKAKKMVLGLISSRGSVIPVINMRLLLEGDDRNPDFNKYILVNVGSEKLALAVDDIEDVIDIDESAIEYLDKEEVVSLVKFQGNLLTLLNRKQLERI